MLNKNELLIDRVKRVVASDIATGEMLFSITQIEDPSISTSAESEEIVDAVGAVVSTLYKAKKAEFSGSNSFFSLDLAAAQFGGMKIVASSENKIVVPMNETLKVTEEGTITLSKTPAGKVPVPFIYSITGTDIGTAYKVGSIASATDFSITGNKITVPTGLKGSVFVEYSYESENAMMVRNRASAFPSMVRLTIYVLFKDICTDSLLYGTIICPRAKLNPESIEIALTSTGKHAFSFSMMKAYCDDNDELFSVIVAQ